MGSSLLATRRTKASVTKSPQNCAVTNYAWKRQAIKAQRDQLVSGDDNLSWSPRMLCTLALETYVRKGVVPC